MKRLLCIVSAMDTGGAETFLMKVYRQLNHDLYQMDFCVNKTINFYAQEIQQMGGHIYVIPPKTRNPIKWFLGLYHLVKSKKYQYVIRVNEHSLSSLDLLVAKCAGAKNLIMRSSNASSIGLLKKLTHKMFIFLPRLIPNCKIAPSDLAAHYTFGNKTKFHILPNGLDIEAFKFSEENRENIQQELKTQGKFVIGHIGRFNSQKNHKFLLKIFAEIKKLHPDVVLWLVGKGELEQEIRKEVIQLGLQNDIRFLGVRTDIPALLSAMDILVFPSLFEGMPNTVLEAQTSGLSCLISDTITMQVKQTNLVHFMTLNKTAEVWARQALQIINTQLLVNRLEMAHKMHERGYDIKSVAKQFIQLVFGEVIYD